MDTSTHIIMGFGLAGLAYIDPAVAGSPELAQAIMIGTVIGSNAPDFDYGIKLLKGNGMYIEHHRGASHSIPALFLWTVLVSSITFLFFKDVLFFPLLYWTFLAVILHVGFDILNAYGTQAARPFTKKWFSLNFVPLFDPFIILVHLIGFSFWTVGIHSGFVFLWGYLVIIGYLVVRFFISQKNKKQVIQSMDNKGICTIVPTVWIRKWHVVYETDQIYYVGILDKNGLHLIHTFEKHDQLCPYIKASRDDHNVKHFLANSGHVHAMYVPQPKGYEVRWIDLRFRHNHHYPYMAVVKLDKNLQVISSYTGWIYQSKKLQQKLVPSKSNAVQM
ncbi:metal-dependent hydrolase [Metabacillus litoralis]|uniref:metal-dependent hydrolase n=1 Tax=Metabacillus litoralis TaxID=152268 RepID=UPI00203BE3D7|nr:metal-dependent hydrolase [Metabacillus litoralis]MCM3410717.1 metal-dependent hydrolase [Metabacillus litoralis]